MRNLRYILLILCLCPALLWGQRRFSAAERWEYRLAGKGGFSQKDVNNSTDVLFGLHASQYTGSHHLFGLSLEGSWSAFLHNMPTASFTPGGGAIGFRLLYEYQYSGLLVQTGLGIAFQRVNTYCSDTTIYHEHVHDLWMGEDRQLILRHQFKDRRDVAQQLYGQLPVYLGHYILSPAGIGYFLAGVHINYMLTGSTRQTLTGSTAGKYYDFIGVWEEMDNHGFRKDVPIERKGPQLDLKLDVMAHVEMGYEYTTSQSPHSYRVKRSDRIDCRLRFAGFADFGILNICPNGKGVYYGLPEATIYDFPTYQMDHVFSTKDASSYWLRNLFVGVRFSVLFGFSSKERCILCDPWRH
jgi:hypothetical protein